MGDLMRLKTGMKVRCLRTGHIGVIQKLGAKTSKVRIPIFNQPKSVVRQIKNENLEER
jgi:hypothetical protein